MQHSLCRAVFKSIFHHMSDNSMDRLTGAYGEKIDLGRNITNATLPKNLTSRGGVHTHSHIDFPKNALQLKRSGRYITFLYREGYLVGYFASIHGLESSLRT